MAKCAMFVDMNKYLWRSPPNWRTHARMETCILAKFGSARAICEAIAAVYGEAPRRRTVQSWRDRGKIPRWWVPIVIKAAKRKRIKIA